MARLLSRKVQLANYTPTWCFAPIFARIGMKKKVCTKMLSINRCYKKQKQYPGGVKSYWEEKLAFFAPLLANIHD